MEKVLDLCEERDKNCAVVIDDENSIIGQLIKETLINQVRRKKLDYTILKTNIDDGQFLIKEFALKEFPCVLFFKNQKLIKLVTGFSYNDYHHILVA